MARVWIDLAVRLWRIGIPPLFLAMGVTLGGGLIGAFGSWMVSQGPGDPVTTAYRIRIWAVAIAIGGTLTAFENLERGLASRALPMLLADSFGIIAAYFGAQWGYWLIRWLVGV